VNEENRITFKGIPLPDEVRQSIVCILKEEGFSEEQMNSMAFEKIWKLYLESVGKTTSDMIAEIARAFERNPQLASTVDPTIKEINRQLEDLENSLEKELDKKKETRGTSHERDL
jgi:hypothetical protein